MICFAGYYKHLLLKLMNYIFFKGNYFKVLILSTDKMLTFVKPVYFPMSCDIFKYEWIKKNS